MKAVKEAEPSVKWFKTTKQLGEVRLLPSDIDPRVLIRYQKGPKEPNYYGSQSHGACDEFSVVCLINSRERDVTNHGYGSITKGIKTPKAIFHYDFNSLKLKQKRNIGYLFRPDKDRPTLSEMLKHPKAFHFPHVYDNSYMCLSNRNHDSPRILNNIFWDSNFNSMYWPCMGSSDKTTYERYIAKKNPMRDEDHKTFLAKYTDFFETDKKPLAIFVSENPQVLAKATDSLLPDKKLVVGFAWFVKGRWWVYLKNNIFLRFNPEQIKAV